MDEATSTTHQEDPGPSTSGPSLAQRGLLAIHAEHERRERLRNRHEGLAWLIWALTTPMVFVTLEAAGLLFSQGPLAALAPGGATQFPAWVVLFWVPWIFAGATAVHALWRSAVVRDPDISEGRPPVPLVVAGWILVAGATWGILRTWLLPGLNTSVYLTIGIGLAWTLTGWLDPYGLTYHGRRVSLAVGLAVLLAGLVSIVAFPPWPDPGALYASWLGAGVTALAPFAGGLVQIRYGGDQGEA